MLSHGRESPVPLSQPSLPSNRVFVVQFRAQPTEALSAYDGHVEPVVSGEAARVHSVEKLLAFMIRVLADVQAASDSPECTGLSRGDG